VTHEAWLTRALGDGGDEEARDHVARCPSCRQEWEDLRRLEEELRKAAPPAGRDDLWTERTFGRARQVLRPAVGEGARSRWGMLAALLLACVGLGAGLGLLPPSPSPQAGGVAELALLWDVDRDDGTLALLDGVESLAAEVQSAEEADGASGAGEAGGGGSHG